MAINLGDNINITAGLPTDYRYSNGTAPYSTCAEVNSSIDIGVRYTGLTVNILGVEYWYKDGKLDVDLVEKTTGANLGYTTAVSSGVVTSSTGTDATIPAATILLAGLMACADKVKLDGIAVGAEVNVGTNLSLKIPLSGVEMTICSNTGSDVSIPLASPSLAGIVTNNTQTFAGTKTTTIWSGSTCLSSPVVCATTSFNGAGTNLTGTAASLTVGCASSSTTVTGAAQSAITSLGLLTSLGVSGLINGNPIGNITNTSTGIGSSGLRVTTNSSASNILELYCGGTSMLYVGATGTLAATGAITSTTCLSSPVVCATTSLNAAETTISKATTNGTLKVYATSGYDAFQVYEIGQTYPKFYFIGSSQWFGAGGATANPDVSISRVAACVLKIDGNSSVGSLEVTGNIKVPTISAPSTTLCIGPTYAGGVTAIYLRPYGIGSTSSQSQFTNTATIIGTTIQATGYKSSDGTAGSTQTFTFVDNLSVTRTLVFKNGLLVSTT